MEVVRKGKLCSLVRFQSSFVDQIQIAGNNPNVSNGVLSIPIPFTFELAQAYTERGVASPNQLAICVIDEDDKPVIIGSCGARTHVDLREAHIADIGFVIVFIIWQILDVRKILGKRNRK
jgi:hypothetical protein